MNKYNRLWNEHIDRFHIGVMMWRSKIIVRFHIDIFLFDNVLNTIIAHIIAHIEWFFIQYSLLFARMSASEVLTKAYDINSASQGENNNDIEAEGTWRLRYFYVFGFSLKKGMKKLTMLMIVSPWRGNRIILTVSLKAMVKSLLWI